MKHSEKQQTDQNLLGAGEPSPFTILNENSTVPCILLGEHAGTAIPAVLDNLGLDEQHLTRHFSHDIGIRDVLENIARTLNLPALLANYSRLVVDVNRDTEHPTAFPRTGEDMVIPGNLNLTRNEKKQRIAALYDPFDSQLKTLVDRFLDAGKIPLLVSIHSFTPQFYNHERPWHIGFLWVDDRRATDMIMPYFKNKGFTVGENEPYDARMLRGTMLNKHADDRRLPSLLFEIRNDQIETQAKAENWAQMIAEALDEIIGHKDLHSFYEGERSPVDFEKSQRYFDEITEKAKRGDI